MTLELAGVDLRTEEVRTGRLLLRPPRPRAAVRGGGRGRAGRRGRAHLPPRPAHRRRRRDRLLDGASQEVARRAGFRAAGVLRGGITRLDGTRSDAAVFVRDRADG